MIFWIYRLNFLSIHMFVYLLTLLIIRWHIHIIFIPYLSVNMYQTRLGSVDTEERKSPFLSTFVEFRNWWKDQHKQDWMQLCQELKWRCACICGDTEGQWCFTETLTGTLFGARGWSDIISPLITSLWRAFYFLHLTEEGGEAVSLHTT